MLLSGAAIESIGGKRSRRVQTFFRGSTHRGIGSRILKDPLREAAVERKPARIHVETLNPIHRFNVRTGFRIIEDKGVQDWMEWTPGGSS